MTAFLGKLSHSSRLKRSEMFNYLFWVVLDYRKLMIDFP